MRIHHNNTFISTLHSFLLVITITSVRSHLINYTETINQLSTIGEKQFKGTWKLSPLNVLEPSHQHNGASSSYSFPNYFNDLMQNNGDIFLSITFSTENKHKPILSFDLSLLDGVYKETWIKLVSSRPFRYENQSYYFDMFVQHDIHYTAQSKPKRQLITITNEYANYSSYKLCKAIQHYKSKYMPIDNITITLEGASTLSRIKGNVISFLSEFNLTFQGELLTQNDIISNRLEMKYFLFGFAVVGLIHFFTLMSTIRTQRSKRNFHFRNFCPYLIANDMMFNCVVFISAITLSFEYKSQGEGFAVISLLYFVIFAFIEGVVLYFTYNFENIVEMKRLLITCSTAIVSFIIIGNFLFVCDLFIIILLYSSFIPQIVYNAFHFRETPNAIPKKNILGLMLNKMYLPLYFKGYSGNVFKTKVNNMFVWSYVAVLALQIVVLLLQNKYGGDVVVPYKCRKGYYKYTKNVRDVIRTYAEFHSNNQCAICLGTFVSDIDEVKQRMMNKKMNCLFTIIKERFVDKQKYIMVTPCKHFFHCECLRSWVQVKTVCPICRKNIPKMVYD